MPGLTATFRAACLLLSLALSPHLAFAAGTDIAFAGLKTDTTQPVEVQADSLSVNQADGTAVFSGNVIVTQGDMKLSAGQVVVAYAADTKAIAHLTATGGVIVSAGTDAAKADAADYAVATGEVTLTGNVLLTQGQAAISGQTLILSLKTGLGSMQGRVTTTFVPAQN